MKQLDKQLQEDCHRLTESQGISILLHKNASIPWFILVPLSDRESYRELFELPLAQRKNLNELSDRISGYLLENFESEKINVAAIGNMVEQFHYHIVGRRSDDCCWPNPIWGNLEENIPYADEVLAKISADIAAIARP